MTKQEFNFWWDRTNASKGRWVRDEITGHNSKMYSERDGKPETYRELFYTGGESGIYVEINGAGLVEVGKYEKAYPHIGEAVFTCKHKNNPMYQGHPAKNFDEAFAAICERLGLQFLIDIMAA